MFFSYDEENFPIVFIKFDGRIESNNDFNLFLKKWEELYNHNQKFILVFDTLNMDFPHIKYCFKMTAFIKKLRKKNPQFLQKSYIIVENNFVVTLLKFIFFIQPPVANVYLTNDYYVNVIENIKNDNCENIQILDTFLPGNPFLPFL